MIDFPAIQAEIDAVFATMPNNTVYRDALTPADYEALNRYKAAVYAEIDSTDMVSKHVSCDDFEISITVGVQSATIADMNQISFDVGGLMESAGYDFVGSEFEKDTESDTPLYERRLIFVTNRSN